VFGNSGTHVFDSTIATGTGASPDVLLALTMASDLGASQKSKNQKAFPRVFGTP
jgi:hypothetical protein